jgi:hypothetical protein
MGGTKCGSNEVDCDHCGGTGEVQVDRADRRGEHYTVSAICSCVDDAQPDDEAEERRDDVDSLTERNAPGAGWSL